MHECVFEENLGKIALNRRIVLLKKEKKCHECNNELIIRAFVAYYNYPII